MPRNLRSVDLNLIPVFMAVMEEGQLTGAAQRLGMSQPAVSAALKRLRLTLGTELFSRTRSGLCATPAARELYHSASQGLQILTSALDARQHFDPAHSDRLFRLMAADYFDSLILGPLIRDLRDHSRHIAVQVVPLQEKGAHGLISGEVDMALDVAVPDDSRLVTEEIATENLVVVARQDHPAITGSLTMEQFLAAEHVVLPALAGGLLPLERFLGHPMQLRRIGARVGQVSNQLMVAAGSDLIATVPRRLARRFGQALGLQVLSFPQAVKDHPIHLIWPRVLHHDPAHQWFRERLRQQFARLDDRSPSDTRNAHVS